LAESIEHFVEPHFNWIERQVNPDGGWPEQPGKRSSSLTTAEAVLALLEDATKNPRIIDRGIDFLIAHQVQQGADHGAWQRENSAVPDQPIADLLRTSKAISAISRAIRMRHVTNTAWTSACRNGVEWLKQRRSPNGGWSFIAHQPATAFATSFALIALLEAREAMPELDLGPLQNDFNRLQDWCRADGTVGDDVAMKPLTTIATLILVRFSRRLQMKINFQPGMENRIEKWIMRQRHEIFSPIETTIAIDPVNLGNNYAYTVMLNATIINLFVREAPASFVGRWWRWCKSRSYRRLRASARHALRKVRSEQANNGGFPQPRVFTWSTCMITAAIARCRGRMKTMPSELGSLQLAELLLMILVIVNGIVRVVGYFNTDWAKTRFFDGLSNGLVLASAAAALLVAFLERRSVWGTLKTLLKLK